MKMLLHLENVDTGTPRGMKVKTGGLEGTAGRLSALHWMQLQTLVPLEMRPFIWQRT